MWPEIEYDNDGYPTNESLKAIKEFPLDMVGARDFVRSALFNCAEKCCASYEEIEETNNFGRQVIHGQFSTGGWSGAEDLIEIIENRFDTCESMIHWNRGGHYIFEFEKKEN
jgi:hypothetical protein